MLVTSIFSFSHNVFKRTPIQGRLKSGLCGKELIEIKFRKKYAAFHNIFSEDFIFTIKYTSLQKISLSLGFTHHRIDFGYCNSAIFIFRGCFM